MKGLLRNAWYHFLQLSGLIAFLRWRQRNEVTIVYLHSTLPSNKESLVWQPCRSTLDETFLDQVLRTLGRRHTFVSLTEAEQMLRGEIPTQPNSLVVTLDDGYLNNLTIAHPIFLKHGVTPTVFVITDTHAEPSAPWFERVDYLLQQAADSNLDIQFGGIELALTSTMTRPQRREAILKVVRESRKQDESERYVMLESLFDDIERRTGKRFDDLPSPDICSALMSTEDLHKAEAQGMRIASHTATHRRLALLDDEAITAELEASKEALSTELGYECRHLAYPEGVYDERVAKIAGQAGYSCSLTCDEGTNAVGCDMHRLKRFPLFTYDLEPMLWSRLYGVNELTSRIWARLIS